MFCSLKRLLPASILHALPFANMKHQFYLAALGVKPNSSDIKENITSDTNIHHNLSVNLDSLIKL